MSAQMFDVERINRPTPCCMSRTSAARAGRPLAFLESCGYLTQILGF
jgi:hypothetical protein